MMIDYPWFYVALCLILGGIYAAVMYFVGKPSFGRPLRFVLAAVRFLVVSFIALLLLSPVRRQTVHERRLPHVVLLQDASLSVSSSADSSFSFDKLAEAISGNCRVSRHSFGDNSTDIAAALDRYRGDDVAALVLASDGIATRGMNPISAAEHLAFPIHTVALGDTTRHRDAAIAELRVGRIATLGSQFPLLVDVAAHLLAGQRSTLSVVDDAGKTLYSRELSFPTTEYATAVDLSLPAERAGMHSYTVTLSVVDGESNVHNNKATFFLDVIDTRRRVAIVANAKHPDLGALKRSIESNVGFEADVVMADKAESPSWHADDYSLLVLHNLPSTQHPSVAYSDNMPRVFVIGLQTDLSRFNALRTGLELNAKSKSSNEVTAIFREGFSLFHYDRADADAIESMPPLDAPFAQATLSSDVQTLFGARLSTIDMQQPIVAATTRGVGSAATMRHVFIWGEGLWRWRLADWQANQSHAHFDRLVSQIVGFASMQHNRNRLQVDAARRYSADEMPHLSAQLYNESLELTNTPDVHLHLTGDSVDADYLFLRDGEGYRLELPPLHEGIYRYLATADGQTVEGSFAVEAIANELRNTVADHALLRSISSATAGTAYTPSTLDALTVQLSQLKPIIYSHTKYAALMHLPLVLLLIVLLLGAEWVLRKYFGSL